MGEGEKCPQAFTGLKYPRPYRVEVTPTSFDENCEIFLCFEPMELVS